MEILYDEQDEEDVPGLLWGQEPAHANAGMPARAAAAAAMSALCMFPHTAIYVSAYCCICVHILLELTHANAGGRPAAAGVMSTYYYTCVCILPYMCPDRLRHVLLPL